MSDPYITLFKSNWRGDHLLHGCSLAARGLWIEMIAIMDDCSPRGHLVAPNGDPMPLSALAMQAGRPEAEVAAALAELEANRVFSRTPRGIIFSRRMARDAVIREARSEAGKASGRARTANKRPNKTPTNGSTKPEQTPQQNANKTPTQPFDFAAKAEQTGEQNPNTCYSTPYPDREGVLRPPSPPAATPLAPSESEANVLSSGTSDSRASQADMTDACASKASATPPGSAPPTPIVPPSYRPKRSDPPLRWGCYGNDWALDEYGKRRLYVGNIDIAAHANDVCTAAGIADPHYRTDWMPLVRWLNDGVDSTLMLEAIAWMASRPDYPNPPPHSLAFFDGVVRNWRQQRARR